jgi:hypothetical protein
MVASMPPTRSIYASPEAFESSFRILAIISWEGGQFVSHVLQWNTSAPDFSSASNSSRLNVTVWLWSFGQTISKSMVGLLGLLLFVRSAAAAARSVFSIPDGTASVGFPIWGIPPGSARWRSLVTAFLGRMYLAKDTDPPVGLELTDSKMRGGKLQMHTSISTREVMEVAVMWRAGFSVANRVRIEKQPDGSVFPVSKPVHAMLTNSDVRS